MLTFLFWNVMRRDLSRQVAAAAAEHDADVVFLAESGADDADVAGALGETTGRLHTALAEVDDKVRAFSRLARARWRRRQLDAANGRISIWTLSGVDAGSIIVAAVHLLSKNNATTDEQFLLVRELADELRWAEHLSKHRRTVLVGDLNMNPFELGVTGMSALHAVMTRRVAERGSRVVQGRDYPFFYNPMWGLLGDRSPGPAGTYFHHSAGPGDLFWHMLDQVLIRPDLLAAFRDVQILDTIAGESLLTGTGVPHAAAFSDHLPIVFRLELG